MPNENPLQAVTLNDAIAWCLEQRDSGTRVSEQEAIETFPQYAEEIRSFLRNERKIEHALAQPVDAVPAPVPPRTFGKYQLRRTIGTGSFGQVFLAWDTEMHRHVALKTARFLRTDGQARDRFLHEARASSQLRHQGIVRIYDFGEVDDTVFLALEFVDGKPLSDWATGPVPPKQAAQMVAAIVDALVHAHGSGIVHRDLTTKNIIVDDADKPNILDFGLAKLVLSESTLRLDGQVVGTPAYVSPEQVTGKAHEVDGRSDIYSVGVILYELLTGERPLDGPLDLLLHRIQFETPSYLTDVDPSIPTELADICKKCLEKDPEDRYATAANLLTDLEGFLDGKPVPHEKSSSGLRFAALATIAALVIGCVYFNPFSTPNRPDATMESIADGAMIVASDYTDLDLGLTLASSNPSFDEGGLDWKPSDVGHPDPSDCVVQRDWTPDSSVRSESTLGSTYLSLPDRNDIGFSQQIEFDSDVKYQVLAAYCAIEQGWANLGITYFDRDSEGKWREARVYRQRIREPSTSQRGAGDGMTLHRIGCEVPENAVGAVIWVWQETSDSYGLNVDEIALYDYVPAGKENLVLEGKFTIGEVEREDR